MDKTMFADIADPQEKFRLLKDNCDATEEDHYLKTLTQDELDQKREQHTDNCIENSRLEGELKKVKDEYKGKMDPISKTNKLLLEQIKTGQEEVFGRVFHFKDLQEGTMNTFNEKGEFIGSRRLSPDEKQGRLFVATAVNQ